MIHNATKLGVTACALALLACVLAVGLALWRPGAQAPASRPGTPPAGASAAPTPTVTVTRTKRVPGPTKTVEVNKYPMCGGEIYNLPPDKALAAERAGGCVWHP